MKETLEKLKAGTKIILTKIDAKNDHKTRFSIGTKRAGTIKSDVALKKPIFFIEQPNSSITRSVKVIKAENEKIIIETRTSKYSVRVVEDENDAEFKAYLGW